MSESIAKIKEEYKKTSEFGILEYNDELEALFSFIDRYNDEKKGKIIIVDSTESTYVFYENGAWNYKVDLMNRISL